MLKKCILLIGLEETCWRISNQLNKKFQPIVFPIQKTVELKIKFKNNYDYLLFTSPQAVKIFANNNKINSNQIISIGSNTSKMIKNLIKVDNLQIIQSPKANTPTLITFLKNYPIIYDKKIIHFCSKLTTNILAEQLTFINYQRINAYTLIDIKTPALPPHSALLFFSPSAVKSFINKFPNYIFKAQDIFCLGITTNDYLMTKGIPNSIISLRMNNS